MATHPAISLKDAKEFIEKNKLATPCIVIDREVIRANYKALQGSFGGTEIFYAVKANPHPEVLKLLVELGSSFDIASRYELDLCLGLGADAKKISYGNTIKKEEDIAYAYKKGVRLFAFDSEEELKKISRAAPRSDVFCRILTSGEGADWPLSLKFGCHIEMAVKILLAAKKQYRLNPVGISFHVGSQQNNIGQWDEALAKCCYLFEVLDEKGVHLSMINLGGGFPGHYTGHVQPLKHYARSIQKRLKYDYGNRQPKIVMEPGRSLVADSGIIASEVVLVSKKSEEDQKRWVYLDVGKFNGLIETIDECIRYKITTDRRGKMLPVILAGPTCDSMDVLYKDTEYSLPVSLKPKDRVYFHSTGAYTSSYASVAFNGFPPIETYIMR